MNKKLISLLSTGAMLLAVSASTANAAVPGPSGSFSTAFNILNTSSSAATCQFVFNNSSGGAAFTSSAYNIAAGAVQFIYVPSLSGLASGQYSGVVSCDQQVAVVANHSAATSAESGASYDGIDASKLATTWYSPNAYRNYFNFSSNFIVQNATASSVDVTVSFYAPGSSSAAATQSATIAANGSANFEQESLAGLANGTVYAAKIVGTGNIAVVQNIYGLGANAGQLYTFTPFTAGATTMYLPDISNNFFGFNTALTVQNVDSSDANVTVTYGSGSSQNATIAPNSSAVFLTFLPASGVPSGTLTAAKVTSTNGKNIVAMVTKSNNLTRAAAYTGFSAGTTTVRLPTVTRRFFAYNSAITCQNIGAAATNMTIAYSNGATTTTNNVAANQTAFYYLPAAAGVADNFNGGATVTSSGEPIVCVAYQSKNEAPFATQPADNLYGYEGIN
jgi:hypothetical protein